MDAISLKEGIFKYIFLIENVWWCQAIIRTNDG